MATDKSEKLMGTIGDLGLHFDIHTGTINLPIPAMTYYINNLDIQRSGRGRGGPTYSKVGEVLYKICPSH